MIRFATNTEDKVSIDRTRQQSGEALFIGDLSSVVSLLLQQKIK